MLALSNQISNNFYSALESFQAGIGNIFSGIPDIAQPILSSMLATTEISNSQLARNVVWNCEEIIDTDVEFHKGKAVCSTDIDYPEASGSDLVFKADKEFSKLFRLLQSKEIAFSGSTTYDYDNHRAHHGFLADPNALRAWLGTQDDLKSNTPTSLPRDKE